MATGMKGSYVLVLSLPEDSRLTIGRLGYFDFPAGQYLYFGSALNGLEGRISRHLRREKKLHWHIDYLRQVADIEQVWWQPGLQRRECSWNRAALAIDTEVIARGFGSSDCRCDSHLLRVKESSGLERIQGMVLGNDPQATHGVCQGVTWSNYENSPSLGSVFRINRHSGESRISLEPGKL